VFLVLDGHFSRAGTIQLLDLAQENVVHIVCLPPHCTHKVQPLDVSFMLPFETYYAQEIESWLRMNPTRVLTHCETAGLLGKAYLKAQVLDVKVKGVSRTACTLTINTLFMNPSSYK
jgi:hypothetical protein